jgi:hypothetical protein
MASGRLATLDITNAATDTQLYAVPTNKVASFSVCLTNRTSSAVRVRIALTDATSVGNDEYISYDQLIYPYESYERSGLVLNQGQFIYVRSSAVGVSAVVYGYEE